MPVDCLEHANATVTDLDQAIHFLTTAVPAWRVRGGGQMDWAGKPIRWAHVGSDHCYVALQGGGAGQAIDWRGHEPGLKHVGIVVADLAAVVDRLERAGHPLDHWGGRTAYRNSVYFMVGADFQVEFVEYQSERTEQRNEYPA